MSAAAEAARRRRRVLGRLRRLRSRAQREETGSFVLEGFAPFLNACWSGLELEAIAWNQVLLRNSAAQKLVRRQRAAGVPTAHVSPEEFREVSRTARASGVAAVARQRWRGLGDVDPGRGLCWLALERIRSPGNLGTILRTVEAVGAAGLIALTPRVDPYELGSVRASMGAVFHLELVRSSRAELVRWASRRGVQVVGTSPDAERAHTDVPLRPPLVLLLGEERQGLTPDALELCPEVARIPILGRGDSLNVSVAAGVMLYEVLRRAHGGADPAEFKTPSTS